MTEFALDDIEDVIARRRHLDRLPPAYEADFEAQRLRYYKRLAQSSLVPTILTYNVFLPVDILLLPDTMVVTLFLHTLVSLLIVAVTLAYLRLPNPGRFRWALSVIPLAMISQIMIVYLLNASDNAQHYQYLAIMIVVYSNITQRLGVDFARFVSVSACVIYVAFLLAAGAPLEVVLVGVSMMAAAGYLTTVANRRMQRDDRFNYLQRLREQALRRAVESQSLRDPLTKLANRRFLEREIQRIRDDTSVPPRPVSVLLFDIDHFKSFNDTYGHPAGDACLCRIAETLSGIPGIAIRFGGEEFLVLAEGADENAAYRLAERLRVRIADLAIPHVGNPQGGVVTASFGMATGLSRVDDFAELIAEADAALYKAKRAGRNRTWPKPGRAQAIA